MSGWGTRCSSVLRPTGLSAVSDTDMDRFARLVTRVLHVPVALVSLMEKDRLILPGMMGLPEPWAGRRALPLSHSPYRPRTWADGERADLEDLAAACSAELRLRILSAQRRSAQKVLETARAAAEQARSDAEHLEHEAQAGLDHAELLLRASEELAQTSGL